MNKGALCNAKGQPLLQLSSFFPGRTLLPGSNNHSSRKSLKDSVLQAPVGSLRVTVCYRLMSHNNGNLWFTLCDGLFYVSSTLNSLGLDVSPLASHNHTLFYELYGLNSLTLPSGHIKAASWGAWATEPLQEPGGSQPVRPHTHTNTHTSTCSCTFFTWSCTFHPCSLFQLSN